ncbi:acyltransferase family protein [Ochrobactrum teleogrylli]|uniref:Acyltransferase n=1 Tax=Ochrobactrum teleogrylli TaxID=2479765 RepID=A0ABD5JSK3_9HYPH
MSDFSETRNFGLDIVRAAAITMVLISHARQALVSPDNNMALTFGGWFGVELFFALSGLLIGSILIKMFNQGVTGYSFGRFWFRRWMRTLPAYFFILLFFWIVYGRVQFSDFILLQWPINHNQGVVPVSWSLAVEEWFYILFPLGALAASCFFKKRGMLIAILAAILIPIVVRVHQHYAGSEPISIRVNPFRFDGMAYGVLIAYLIQIKRVRDTFQQLWPLLVIVACLLFAADLYRYSGSLLGLPTPMLPRWYHDVAGYIVTGLSAASIVLVFYFRRPSLGIIAKSAITYISKVSYSLYLWHMLMFSYSIRFFPEYRGPILYFVMIIAAIILSYIPYILIEQPFIKIRDKLTPPNKPTS